MKPPRPSLVGLMGLVVLVAANLAAARVLHARNSEMLVGVALGGLVLQYALFRALRGRRGRAFWAGFLAGGLVAIAGFAWAMAFPEVMGLVPEADGSMAVHRAPGSPLYAAWHGYASLVADRVVAPAFAALGVHPDPDTNSGSLTLAAVRAVIWGLPQGLAAAAGGMLGLGIAARRAGRGRDAATPAVPAACGA